MRINEHAGIWTLMIGFLIVLGCVSGNPLLLCTVPFVISYARGSVRSFQEARDKMEQDRPRAAEYHFHVRRDRRNR